MRGNFIAKKFRIVVLEQRNNQMAGEINVLSLEKKELVSKIIALGQKHVIEGLSSEDLEALLEDLCVVDSFYQEIGGITGYQKIAEKLLEGKRQDHPEEIEIHPPEMVELDDRQKSRKLFWKGISHLAQTAEMVTVGGAADRLCLIDPTTKKGLPAICLDFFGKGLLSVIFDDLHAREYLYYKLTGEQVFIPVALMSSKIKGNADYLRHYCQKHGWFGKESSISIFLQPLVPSFDGFGKWLLQEKGKLRLLPPGHGVIWKAAEKSGIFAWFLQKGCTHAIVRQINNPMAGVDQTLGAFIGTGYALNKDFGIAGVPRKAHTKEGVNVIVEEKGEFYLSNIEYCEFSKLKRVDFSKGYPANTNLLFFNIQALLNAILDNPYPGLIVNAKEDPSVSGGYYARVESMMQNISESFRWKKNEPAKTFVTISQRLKTFSAIKRGDSPQLPFIETPIGCYFDYCQNAYDLLMNYCGVSLPSFASQEDFLNKGPSFIFLYHPILGPCYEIIAQKIKGGKIADGSEIELHIADLYMENLDLNGSFSIVADQMSGSLTKEGQRCYNHQTGRAYFKDVTIVNRGHREKELSRMWQKKIAHSEKFSLHLKGHSEFIAEGVSFMGSMHIEVEDGMRMRALMQEGKVVFISEPLEGCAPFYLLQKDSEGVPFFVLNFSLQQEVYFASLP